MIMLHMYTVHKVMLYLAVQVYDMAAIADVDLVN